MLILVHNTDTVSSILDEDLNPTYEFCLGESITSTLMLISKNKRNKLVVWCHESLLSNLNTDALSDIFHHKRILATFNPTSKNYLPDQIGYIDRSFFIKINRRVTYPTWLMSSFVGGINTEVLYNLSTELKDNINFNYFLVSLAKRAMVEGLFCYSEPRLLSSYQTKNLEITQATKRELFKFVKQHYKWVWVIFLSWCYAIFERKLSVFSFFTSLFNKQLNTDFKLETIPIQSCKKQTKDQSIDVIIPTIGRKKYLYDVLKDLAMQTHLPKNVIIVEQNPKPDSVSELEYIVTDNWPFKIKHTFTHKPGVCNARNLALSQVESPWTLLGDDDNRFESNLIEKLFAAINKYGVNVLTTVYLQPHEKQTYLKTAQTSIFGAGNSIIKSELIAKTRFNLNYEFNYGEDTDFGMQLRYLGNDVVNLADIKITHLKAPIGGYRTKIKQLWEADTIKPKPSPTIQLLYQTYFTMQQIQGYKLLLFIKKLKDNRSKKIFSFIKLYNKQWQQSILWSQKLKNRNA